MYPPQLHIELPVWSGRFNSDVAGTLVDSPARQEVAQRLLTGQTAVWLVLESAEAKANDEAAALVTQQLKELEKTLELPELTASPDDEVRSAIPLKVAFSVLRVQRDDPREAMLTAMLLGSEPDLKERTEPIVFPVFGRGRALFGLIGAGITADNIADSAGFLVGPCSCQLKQFNPGFDLLNIADWDRIYGDDAAAVALVTQAEDAAAAQEGVSVPIPTGPPAPAATPDMLTVQYELVDIDQRSGWLGRILSTRVLLLGGVVLALLLAVVALLASLRSQTRTKHESE
jgi:hypothetical protein